MKQMLLIALILGGCAALPTPQRKPVDVPTTVETPVVSKPVEVTQPTVPAVEVNVPVAKATRLVLEYPIAYKQYAPRVEKFFQLALTDPTVLNKATFDYSDATPTQIRERIAKGFNIRVTTYQPSIWKGGKWSKVVGYHSAGTIYLNTYYVNRHECEVINTLVHEPMHYLGYSHGDNSSVGKDNSVPYWMGDRAEELCREGKI